MNYDAIKKLSLSFTKDHPAYFWSVFEFAMVCAAGYSILGLVTMVTGAMATGNSVLMLLEFILAPVYAILLFAIVTVTLSLVLVLPYALMTRLALQDSLSQVLVAKISAVKKSTRHAKG